MIPVATEVTNWTYHLPGRPGEGDMPCVKDNDKGTTQSFWKLESDDPLHNAEMLCVQTYGFKEISHIKIGWASYSGHAATLGGKVPVVLHPLKDEHGDPIGLELVEGIIFQGRQFQIPLDDDHKAWLRDGNLFTMVVPMVPPMPVSVWLAE